MITAKKISKNIKYQLVLWPLVVIVLFLLTSPKQLIILSFLFFVIFWWWLSLVVLTLYERFKRTQRTENFYRISSVIISFCITILLALGTLHQLGFMDIIFCVLFGLICVFYLKRRLAIGG